MLKEIFKNFDLKTQILIRVALIGVIIGVMAVAFRVCTEKISHFLFGSYYTREHWYDYLYLPLVCMLGGLLASFITQEFAEDAKGSGIPQVKFALNTHEGFIRLRTVFVKFIGGVVGIASGLSLGREGPTIQIGAGLGSKISKVLGGKHRKRAIASGAGAGLAAAFNTPIAGVLFVIEELDHNFSSVSLGPAIVCSVCAAVTCRALYGDFFTFHFQTESSAAANLTVMPLYLFLGVIAAICGAQFQKSIMWALDIYKKHLAKIPPFQQAWLWGGVAGLLTGIIGLWIPQAIGGGHTALEGVLAQAYTWWWIPAIFLAKYLLTVIAYGSGVPGGIFAPSLIMGALLGSMLGNIASFALPNVDINPANFAFVGMGAFFTAISRAPITSIVMLFELTGNYELVLPLMFACIIANISAEKLVNGSIYENLLSNDGINIKEHSNPSYLQKFSIGDAMTTDIDCVKEDLSLKELTKVFDKSDHSGFPVLNANNELVGVITKKDIQRVSKDELDPNTKLRDFMSADLKFLHATDCLNLAIMKLYEYKIGRILIVQDQDPKKLVGIITRSDIIHFEANQELDY